jgi:hypothetical protein
MKKISVKNIILFRNKPEKSQKTFLDSLKKKSEVKLDNSGGDYWVRSLSALSNVVSEKNTEPIKEKIANILEDFKPNIIKQTNAMYQRNLDILYNYEDFDVNIWLPENAEILNKISKKAIIEINGVPVQITPNQIYSFERESKHFVGAIWFLAKLEGFKTSELGIFAEALYIYLTEHFGNKFEISPENCLIIDVLNKKEVNYKMLMTEEIPHLLIATLEDIRKFK